jgi:NADPH-dependent 2,4-dienoyl-CoA reductase/sulfur reductase-like enzyme/DNA-binding transcriptional ArsR family regulator
LIIATGATPVIPAIEGLSAGLQTDRVFLVHTIADARALMSALSGVQATRALIIGAGYIGLELAEALTTRGVNVAQFEAREHLLATIDPTLAGQLEAELAMKGIELVTGTRVSSLVANDDVTLTLSRDSSGNTTTASGDIAIVVAGVRPETDLAVATGARLSHGGAIWVNRRMETGIDGIFAAGDCVITHHQLLGESYLPLGTTAHKQGRIAGAVAVGKTDEEFRGVVGTQVVKVFHQVVARTGLTELEASTAGFKPFTITINADDHKRYYPGARTISIRLTGDVSTHRLLGIDMLGPISSAVHKRIDVAAAALQGGTSVEELIDLDLAYTPPLGTPWDALQIAAMEWLQRAPLRQKSTNPKVALGQNQAMPLTKSIPTAQVGNEALIATQAVPLDGCTTPDHPIDQADTLDDPELAQATKALGNPTRIKIFRLIAERQTCITGELVAELPLAQSTVSEHLRILREANLIQGEIEGPRTSYCINQRVLASLKHSIVAL